MFAKIFNREKFDSFVVCGDFEIGKKDCDWNIHSPTDYTNQKFFSPIVDKDFIQPVTFKTAACGIMDFVMISKSLEIFHEKTPMIRLTVCLTILVSFRLLNSNQFRRIGVEKDLKQSSAPGRLTTSH